MTRLIEDRRYSPPFHLPSVVIYCKKYHKTFLILATFWPRYVLWPSYSKIMLTKTALSRTGTLKDLFNENKLIKQRIMEMDRLFLGLRYHGKECGC